LSEEEIQDAGHDQRWVGNPDDVLDDGVGNKRVDPLGLSKELRRVVLREEEMVKRRGDPVWRVSV
jgi:hypothetical protein